MQTLITNARIMAPTIVYESGWLLFDGRKIISLGANPAPSVEGATVIDASGLTLLPGFVDVHVHGAVGHEAMDNNPDALHGMAKFYAQHGVTSFLPTTWTESRAKIMGTLSLVAQMMGPQPEGATILGVHLEGPYIDVAKRGAQREDYVRRAEPDEALAFLDVDVIRLLAMAPEYEENWWLIDECRKRGVTVSAAHSSATHDQMQHGIDLGITQATHTYNAMTGLHHREPGGLGAVMSRPEVACELIADNIHVHPTAMKILYKAKGPEGIILISDAIRAAGMPDGEYRVDDDRTVIVKDGVVLLPSGSLAGSTLTMDRALYNFMAATGEPLEVLWPCASLNGARSAGVAGERGSLEKGKIADLVLVDDDINVQMTIAEGVVVYRNEAFSG
ncbi:MAG: N-acetylglucosamine-6-phosphate deacetylase [Anaerolineaceae bacterium]|nr:N-acetylglucosamine-6-phosphate deacetylase [Anaerolineaceae bacterium]